MESKGILRTAPEEFLLASQYRPHDELFAEFVRTFRHTFFYGIHYINRFDALAKEEKSVATSVVLPKIASSPHAVDQVSLYGFRGMDPRVYYLSPWGFIQWWYPHRLRAPSKTYSSTKWMPGSANKEEKPTPGIDFVLNEKKLAERNDIIVFLNRDDIFTDAMHKNIPSFATPGY